jgi:hypothetical protein
MNSILPLNIKHVDYTRTLRDWRKTRKPELVWSHIYYVGFKILTRSEQLYRHALILADDFDAFLEGVAGEYSNILDQQTVADARNITLVFVRNMTTQSHAITALIDYQNIATEIQEALCKGDGEHYMVFGTVGENRICLIRLHTDNALTAIDEARAATLDQLKETFIALEVCQADPEMTQCYALFDAAAERIKILMNSGLKVSGVMH